MGVARLVTTLPPEPADKTLPVLDRRAELIRKVQDEASRFGDVEIDHEFVFGGPINSVCGPVWPR
jgi:hypothetical protein